MQLLALELHPNLSNEYLGTSPRRQVENTTYVFSASEFPGYIVIPVHCELSFLPNPPSALIFYAHQPTSTGGETPLSDFAAVWKDLDANIRESFAISNMTLKYVREYFDENKWNLNPFLTKAWQQMFSTQNRFVLLCSLVS
jgi:alpha-ketoglutarate-dependent taurine dioxygenase